MCVCVRAFNTILTICWEKDCSQSVFYTYVIQMRRFPRIIPISLLKKKQLVIKEPDLFLHRKNHEVFAIDNTPTPLQPLSEINDCCLLNY